MNVLRDLFEDWKVLTSDSFFFKTKLVTGYYWIDTIEKQALFSSFYMVGNNFETLFQVLQRHPIF